MEPPEQIQIDDLEPSKKYLRDIHVDRARTENRLALILVSALVAALPVSFIGIWILPSSSEAVREVAAHWFSVVGPLAGAAVGIGGMSRNRGVS